MKAKQKTFHLLLALIMGTLLCTASAFAETVFKSGTEKTSLLELYTSQGCYSCPPAENWLNALKDSPQLWSKVVPVAFHVDYWDYLGWKDPYGMKQNQKRHYAYKFQGHTKAIYTPEVILNGADYTIWRKGEAPRLPATGNVGELELSIDDENGIRVYFSSSEKATSALKANIALLGFGIVAKISAGENDGKTLHHEFVALEQDSKTAHPVGQLYLWKFPPIVSDHARERTALIAWLDKEGDNRPIQATGGWID